MMPDNTLERIKQSHAVRPRKHIMSSDEPKASDDIEIYLAPLFCETLQMSTSSGLSMGMSNRRVAERGRFSGGQNGSSAPERI